MPNPPELPLWLSLIIVIFLLIGSIFTLIGAIGLAFFRNFYDRLHMPGLGATTGAAAILTATTLYSSYNSGKPVLLDALILFFLTLAAPITMMMLARAAAMRDFTKSWRDSSENMFWRLARDNVTDETDAQVEKKIAREDKRAQSAENKTAAAPEQAEAKAAAKAAAEPAQAATAAAEPARGKIKSKTAAKTGKNTQSATGKNAPAKPKKHSRAKPKKPL